jgi:hypothetical protein
VLVEADDKSTRRPGDLAAARGQEEDCGGRVRVELLAACDLGEGTRGPAASAASRRSGYVELPDRALQRPRRLQLGGRRRLQRGGRGRDVGPGGRGRRLPLRAALAPARSQALARPPSRRTSSPARASSRTAGLDVHASVGSPTA